jgi:hypothetical protein
MQINPEFELQVRSLLQAGKRSEAVTYLAQRLKVSESDAERLVQAVEHELMVEGHQQVQAITDAGKGIRGCVSIIFKFMSFGFGFFAFSFVAAAIGIYLIFNVPNAVPREGTIVELQAGANGTAPVVQFEWNGELRIYKSTTYSTTTNYTIGQTVNLLVNSEKPEEAVIDSFEERWLMIVVVGGMGIFFLILTFVFLAIGKKIKKPL